MVENRGRDAPGTATRDTVDAVTRIGPLQPEALLATAKRGAVAPADLAPEDVRAVCRMLLVQFAQMGIG